MNPPLPARSGARRHAWWAGLAVLLLLLALDAARPPRDQVSARMYLAAVLFYQQDLHPFSERFVRCRFSPTCSHYSAEAVRRFGIVKGLGLTTTRLLRCDRSVPMGTVDPVPAQ